MNTSQISIFLPNFSALPIRALLNIINSGFTVTEKLSNEDIKEITETAQLLSIDIKEMSNVPGLDKPSQDTLNISVRKVADESYKILRKSTIDDSMDLYHESTETVFDALLSIFDDGNNSIETNFNMVEKTQIDPQMKEALLGFRGKKRSDMSKTKDGKYQCQQCDYENNQSSNLKLHVEAKHEGVRYPCDQCDYKATRELSLKRHQEIKHEGVRYPCDQCKYKGVTKRDLKIHKESKHQGICYSCYACTYKAATPANLKAHVDSIHEGVRYPCDQCDYKATKKSSLKRHRKSKH